MRTRRLFFGELMPGQLEYRLSSEMPQFHYLANVLRSSVGQSLELFNGQGMLAQGLIVAIKKNEIKIQVEHEQQLVSTGPNFHLLLGISKGDRMDYALQKSTELGVSEITPIWACRGEVRLKHDRLKKKHAHWYGVITSACEQSGQNFRPVLNQPEVLEELDLSVDQHHLSLMCHIDGMSVTELATRAKPKKVRFLVGPEGGWTDQEIESLQGRGVASVRLGPRILRTETAPVVMLSVGQFLWGDF